jgi:hypothetical protein
LVLKGGVTISGGHFGVEALLVELRSARNLWAGSFERLTGPQGFMEARDDVASEIAGILAEPVGIIYSALSSDAGTVACDDLQPQRAMALFYKWRGSGDMKLRERVRACLERAITDAPNSAESFACLSMLCSDVLYDAEQPEIPPRDVLVRALALAKHAVNLAPHSGRARQGLALAYWAMGDPAAGIEELQLALSLNPNDMVILAELGLRKTLRGEWDEAIPMLEQACARSSLLVREYRVGLALHHLMHDRTAPALAEMRRIGKRSFLGRIIEAAADTGRKDDTLTEDDVLAHLHGLQLHPNLVQQIRSRLRFE